MPATDPASQPRRYQAHRDNQRERIVDAAEELFIQQGIDRVSISDIARAARLTRNTVYEYFPNKQEVAWAIFQKLVDELSASQAQLPPPDGSGFQRLEQITTRFISALENHPAHTRFLVEFNTLYAREDSAEHIIRVYSQSAPGLAWPIAEIIQQGIDDGSIRAGADPALLAAALLNMINAVSTRFALLGSQISEEYGQPAGAISHEIYRTFLRGIQQPPFPEKTA